MKQVSRDISFQVYRGEDTPFLFEQSLQVYFGLSGCASVIRAKESYAIEQAGMLVINPFELVQVRAPQDAAIICMRLAPSLLRIGGWNEETRYDCYARSSKDAQAGYETLRTLFASTFQSFFEPGRTSQSGAAAYALQLLQGLQVNFPQSASTGLQTQNNRTMQRLSRVLNYIDAHWNEAITLSEIAKTEYLSLSYLSRFFQAHVGVSFSAYLSGVRLRHAAQMLQVSNESVTNIAYSCGFYNVSTFIDAFRRKYGITPGQFRKAHSATEIPQSFAASNVDDAHTMQALMQYLPCLQVEKPQEVTLNLQIDAASKGEAFVQSWRKVLNIGYARDGLLACVQQQIHRAQTELGFTYLRFHGIFDADMYIYDELPDGSPRLRFLYLDMLLDFVLQEGLMPYIEFGFMPQLLAQEDNRIFDRPSVIAGCKRLENWRALVSGTLQHVVARYGRKCVQAWRFTMMSHSYVSLGCISRADYEALFLETYQTVKSADAQFCFGGPGSFAETINEQDGLRGFLQFAKRNSCVPDFIGIQAYPYQHATEDSRFMHFTISQQSAPSILSEDVDFMAHHLELLQAVVVAELGMEKTLVVEECNSTLWQRDLSSDTCYKAVWMAKNFCENHNRADAIGYWLLTDFIEERAAKDQMFHGGYGLLTTTGIPKAGYRALQLLQQLGAQVIAAGEGWVATRNDAGFALLFYNYCHYRNLYRYRYQRLSEPSQAYTVFEIGESKRFRISITGLRDAQYLVKRQRISRAHGSAFDVWMAMGAPAMPDAESIAYLKHATMPLATAVHREVYEGLQLECVLEPLEMELITLVPEDKPLAFEH